MCPDVSSPWVPAADALLPTLALAQLRHGACPLSMRAWEPPERVFGSWSRSALVREHVG